MEPGASVQCGGLNFTTSDFYALPTFLSPDTEHRCPETCRESTTPPKPVFQPNYYRRPGCLSFLVSYLHTRSFLAVLHLRWLQNHTPVRPLVDPRTHRDETTTRVESIWQGSLAQRAPENEPHGSLKIDFMQPCQRYAPTDCTRVLLLWIHSSHTTHPIPACIINRLIIDDHMHIQY